MTASGPTESFFYEAASNRTGFTDPEGGATSYAYDTLNRLQTLTPPVAFTSGSFGLGYDALSRRTSLTRPNGVNTTYAYDGLSRLLSVLHKLGNTTLDGATYTVDNAGNRTAKADLLAGVTSNYAYDPIYELTGVTQGGTTTESYTYDYVGNRLSALGSSGWLYNTSNELSSNPSASYGYDANGNAVTRNDPSGITTFAWDYENRLTSVTLPGSGGTVSFKYDPFGRRIQKVSSAGTSIFAYDDDNLVEETNASGAVVARYAQGAGIDEPLAQLRSATTSFYNTDGLGSITSLSNSSASITDTYTFDSFGKLAASTGTTVNPFRYTARESDTETGFYFYRARYYDPAAGHFLSEDPTQFQGGMNFFTYVSNEPVDTSDPSGLRRKKRTPKKPACDAVFPADRATARLAQLVYAEGDGSAMGDLAVASVVVNRANYGNPSEFGNGILGAINKGFNATGNQLFNRVSSQAKCQLLDPANCQRYKNAALAAAAAQVYSAGDGRTPGDSGGSRS